MIHTCYASYMAQGMGSHTTDSTMFGSCGAPSNFSTFAYRSDFGYGRVTEYFFLQNRNHQHRHMPIHSTECRYQP